MARDPTLDRYWPLGGLFYSAEIGENFPEEAELIGTLTILWTRQELALKRLFVTLLASSRREYAEAIWDRQPTHQARRDLLELALRATKLTKRQAGILKWLVERTKVVADRRNELIHAEYVVEHKTDRLHARVKSPRSTKPVKHQRITPAELQALIAELDNLLGATEAAWAEYWPRRLKRMSKALTALLKERDEQPPQNQQSGSDLQSLRRTHGEEY